MGDPIFLMILHFHLKLADIIIYLFIAQVLSEKDTIRLEKEKIVENKPDIHE